MGWAINIAKHFLPIYIGIKTFYEGEINFYFVKCLIIRHNLFLFDVYLSVKEWTWRHRHYNSIQTTNNKSIT